MNQLRGLLVQAIEESGYSLSGPTDVRVDEHGEPAWVCNARAAIASTPEPEAKTVIPDFQLTLPGVWQAGHYVQMYNDGAAFIEARPDGTTVRFVAKVVCVLGGVIQAVQQVGEAAVCLSDQAAIDAAICALQQQISSVDCCSAKETGLQVILASVGNPDFRQDPSRSLPGVPDVRVWAESLQDASSKCRAYIAEHDLGSGNWAGGNVMLNNVPVARISYNGGIWNLDGSEFS